MRNTDAEAAALALISRAKFQTMSTLDEKGCPETRVLFNLRKTRAAAFRGGAALPNPFATYLGTNTSSRKVAQIRRDGRACLYYADNAKFEGLSLRGMLTEVFDPAVRKALWTSSWNVYYPGGRDGGDFSVFRFDPETARYYHGLKVVEIPCRAPE